MKEKGHLDKLIEHCIWANGKWNEYLSGELSDDAYLSRMISHVILSEQAWFQRIKAQEVDKDIWRTLPSNDLSKLYEKHKKVYHNLLKGDIDRLISYRRFNGDEGRATVSDILSHLCTHSAHHRGQMASYVSGKGLDVPNTDFIHHCRSVL